VFGADTVVLIRRQVRLARVGKELHRVASREFGQRLVDLTLMQEQTGLQQNELTAEVRNDDIGRRELDDRLVEVATTNRHSILLHHGRSHEDVRRSENLVNHNLHLVAQGFLDYFDLSLLQLNQKFISELVDKIYACIRPRQDLSVLAFLDSSDTLLVDALARVLRDNSK